MANFTGTNGADTITGTGSGDRIRGLAGNDRLDGAGGNDRMFGGFDNDKTGSGADTLLGGAGRDLLDGEDGHDSVDGGEGNDTIIAGRGNDAITGGNGNDLVRASGTLDQYDFNIPAAGTLQMTDQVAGRDGKDTLTSVELVRFDDGYVLRLTGANNNPYAVADMATTSEDATVLIDVLANDFDPDETIFGRPSTLSLVSVGDTFFGGTPTISDGKILYDPGDTFDFLGDGQTTTDTFDYTISDDQGSIWTSSVTVTITGAGPAARIDLSTLNGTTGFRLDGAASGDYSGRSVSSAGDVNDDGFDDLIIGAPNASPSAGTYAGASYVVFGKAGGFASSLDLSTLNGTTGFRLDGLASYDQAGVSVASAGDVNGDGLDDLTIGALRGDQGGRNAGASYVIFGKSEGFTSTVDLSTLNGANGFRLDGEGRSVASAGDVNGDGFDDVMVGGFNSDPGGYDRYYTTATRVVFGKAGGFAPSLDLSTLDGANGLSLLANTGPSFGHSVSSAGDVNGDGFDDLIVGVPILRSAGDYFGASFVVFGKAGGFDSIHGKHLVLSLDGTNGFQIMGDREPGQDASSAGDVNGDGFDDVIVRDRAGIAHVVYGKAGGFTPTIDVASLDGTAGFRLDGGIAPVSSAGDVNGDGFGDLIVGAPDADPSGPYSGASYVVFGGDFTGAVTHLGTAASETLTGTSAPETFVGGRGNDVLISGGDDDAFQGGEGNDVVVLARPTFRNIDGGRDDDTIRLTGSGRTLDLTAIRPDKIESIERIDLTGSGNNRLKLTVLDVLDLSDESNSLRVDGNAGDRVVRGGGWTLDTTGGTNGNGTSTIGGQTYQHYTAGQAELLIDTDITALVS